VKMNRETNMKAKIEETTHELVRPAEENEVRREQLVYPCKSSINRKGVEY